MNRDPEQAERMGAIRRQRELAENIDSLIAETLKFSEKRGRELAPEQRTHALLAIIARRLEPNVVTIDPDHAEQMRRAVGDYGNRKSAEVRIEHAFDKEDLALLKLAAARYGWLRENINRLVFGHDAMRRGEFIVEIVPPSPNIAILDNDESAALDRAIDRAIAAQTLQEPVEEPPPAVECEAFKCDRVSQDGPPACNRIVCPNRLPQPAPTYLEPPQLMYCGECGESKLGSPPSCAKPGCPEGPL